MDTLAIDVETYSSVDISTSGAYKYVQAPDFQIMLFAYAFNDEEVKIIDFMNGEYLPQEVNEALNDPKIIKTAFNANFERNAIEADTFDIYCPPEEWQCTMVKALTMGLPGSLGMVGKAMHFEEDKQKMKEGKALIQYFCKPCKPTKANSERTRNLPEHDPEKWEIFKTYCIQDVEVERDIRNKLSIYPTTDTEQRLWELDQRINDRGVGTDLVIIEKAIECDANYSIRLRNEAIEITGLSNPNSAAQLKKWIGERIGHEVTSLTKESVPVLLEEADDENVIRILELRKLMAKTSIKKYQTMKNARCEDGRVRGLLQFYGANRTGRWAGRLVQVQNLPQNHLPDLDDARNCIRDGKFDDVEFLYDSVPDTLSQLIRTAFIPREGNRFIVADFSAIEARVIAWFAGEKWRMDVFKTHGKIYEASASQMFHVPIESVKKGSDLRARGKIAELACIAENQLVLTNQGLVKIQNVTTNMMVWDGLEFVKHEGVIYKGVKEVITYDGLTATKDHLVWVGGQSGAIQFGIAASSGAHIIQSGNSGQPIRICENNKPREKMVKNVEPLPSFNTMHKLWKNSMGEFRQSYLRKIKRMPNLLQTKKNTKMAGQKIYGCKTEMYKLERCKLFKLWGTRDRIQIHLCFRGGVVDDRKLWITKKRDGVRQNKYKWPLRAWKSSLGNTPTELCQSTKVYDIANCGPRNRFTVSNKLVHNCGYGGGRGALIAMDKNKDIPEDNLDKLIKDWRNANTNIVKFWWDCDKAAKKAVSEKTTVSMQFGLKFIYAPGVLFIQLPSGRKLSYIRPKIADGKFGKPIITYEGMEQTTKQWTTLDTYGPKLVENIVQATARDCLAEAMFKVEKAGYDIVMHVHDEIITDVPKNKGSLKEVNAIFGEPIAWAPGLPLSADGYETDYYKKD